MQQYKDIIAVKYDKLTSNKFAIVRGGSSRDVEKREMGNFSRSFTDRRNSHWLLTRYLKSQ